MKARKCHILNLEGTHFAMEIFALIVGDGDPLKSNRHSFLGTVGMLLVDKPLPPPPSPDESDGQSQRPFFEDQVFQQLHHQPPFIDVIKKAASPRIIVTHLPFQCLPPNIEKRAKVRTCPLNKMRHLLTQECVSDRHGL